jgi:hypothetical protein
MGGCSGFAVRKARRPVIRLTRDEARRIQRFKAFFVEGIFCFWLAPAKVAAHIRLSSYDLKLRPFCRMNKA